MSLERRRGGRSSQGRGSNWWSRGADAALKKRSPENVTDDLFTDAGLGEQTALNAGRRKRAIKAEGERGKDNTEITWG